MSHSSTKCLPAQQNNAGKGKFNSGKTKSTHCKHNHLTTRQIKFRTKQNQLDRETTKSNHGKTKSTHAKTR